MWATSPQSFLLLRIEHGQKAQSPSTARLSFTEGVMQLESDSMSHPPQSDTHTHFLWLCPKTKHKSYFVYKVFPNFSRL